MAIKVKNYKVLRALLSVEYAPILIQIILWVIHRYSETVITEGYRQGDPRTHGTIPCRAVDLRSWIFENPGAVRDDINKHWEYDPERPNMQACVYHEVIDKKTGKSKGWHFHVQSHPNTKRRV